MPQRPVPADRLADLQRDPALGLSEAEAADRRARFGWNDIVVAAPSTWIDLLRNTLRDPQIWFLIVVSGLFVITGDYTEAVILVLAMVPLVGMDAFLHRRTQASTQGLASRLAAQATILRDGGKVSAPARAVVPGDLVEIAAGAAFPADGLVVAGDDLQVDESSLTGEAYPVRKQALAVGGVAVRSAETLHWVFAGTRLLTGTARCRVIHTGGETLYGEIVRSALSGSHARTPLQIAVMRLVTVMLVGALLLCVALAAIRVIQGHGWLDAFLSAATLAIAALPEEFPVVFTFFLGVGVYRLARRQALVRRAVAVENIGRVTCICSDKTGTITEGKLALAHHVPAQGLSPDDLVGWAALAARPESGDPLDVALLGAAPARPPVVQLATFPFTEDRRRETSIVRLADGALAAVVKGAPETVFAMCGETADALDAWRAEVTTYAATGHKVIAAASRRLELAEAPAEEPESGYTLHGLLALEDPVRAGVRDAVLSCRAAGIRVIMITGDHPATAGAIARDVGLGGADGVPVVVLADDLDREGAGPGIADITKVDVVARAAPGQKLRWVEALQRAGEIVAVTGDGVNDVPALQRADIGIAMGERGTQSAREVAAIVLLDDNFRTIISAIAEGRQLFRNLQLAFAYLLLIHIPFVLSAAAIPLADNPLLYLPIHIVWLELIIHPTMLLVFQDLPTSDRLLPTTRNGAQFFRPSAWAMIVFAGVILAALLSVGFEYALGPTADVPHARALTIAALIAASTAITIVLSGLKTLNARLVVAASLISLVALVQIPTLATLLHLRPLHLIDWAMVSGAGVIAALLAALVARSLRGQRPGPLPGAV
ncbi:MAG: cation-transporting P-type ATPase [Rhodospirillaceae bacterium]|nr:cation-transporting P-type ATPase [Rhodospirillaceae bacterium]